MDFAPRQDFRLYDDAVSQRKRQLHQATTPDLRFERYAHLFDAIAEAKESMPTTNIRRRRWLEEKSVVRQKLRHAFLKRDKLIREECAADDAD